MAHIHTHNEASSHRLLLALLITFAFVIVEGLAGWFANSLALLTDAAHNLTDVLALGLTWQALRLALRPAHAGKTFGYHRAGILVALINSVTLVVIALGIFYEAYQRLRYPVLVQENVLIGMAVLALFVNAGTAWLVHRGSEHDLNMRSAFVHLMGDVISTLGAVLAGVGIKLTGWQALDPIASLFIGVLILYNGWGILRESVDILLESTPRDLDLDTIVAEMQRIEGVHGVHDLHVWSINQSMRLLSAHLEIDDRLLSDSLPIQRQATELLMQKFDIAHATLQIECQGCESKLLYCDLDEAFQGK